MPTQPSSIESKIAQTIQAASSDLPLTREGPDGLQEVLLRARHQSTRRSRRFRTLLLAAIVAVPLSGAGGAAIAREKTRDQTSREFTRLHPDKKNVNSRFVEAHKLVGTATLRNGDHVRLFVTTRPGTESCADVQYVLKNGNHASSVGFCGDHTSDFLRCINGGMVGYVTNDTVAEVGIVGPHGQVAAQVSLHYYLLPADLETKGTIVTVTTYGQDGIRIGESFITIGE